MELKAILESLIFASDKPLTLKQLKALTGSTRTETIKAALEDIEAEFRSSGIQLVEVGGGFQFRTHPDCAPHVRKLLAGRPPRLTQAMLETLAIVAYRQPITRPEIEDIRGVDCGGVLRLLLERSLIRILGKKEEVGRPILYGTTRQFLEFFNLKDLSQLPTLREFTELSEDMAAQLDPEEAALLEPDERDDVPASAGDSGEAAPHASPAPEVVAAVTETTPALDAVPAVPVQAQEAAPPVAEPAPVAVADTASDAAADVGPAPSAQPPPMTWARATASTSEEDDEDAGLAALDSAMARVDDILRKQRREERERLRALLGETAAAAAQASAAASTPEQQVAASPDEAGLSAEHPEPAEQ